MRDCFRFRRSKNIAFWLLIFFWVQIDGKREGGANVFFRVEPHGPSKLFDQLLRDNQAESDPVCVHLVGILHEPEQLEQLVVVLFLNADPRVLDLHLQQFGSIFLRQDIHTNGDPSFFGELESIALDVEQDLHNPLLVASYQGTLFFFFTVDVVFSFRNVSEIGGKLNA